jgi:intracellular sulfur oxidation DsrE/DsrF family protein
MHRAVVHLNDAAPEKIQAVLQNITNLYKALDTQVQVELVAHGPGLAVATTPATEQLTSLLQKGLTLCACQNSLTAQNLTPADLLDEAIVVPSGVAHLVTRQTEGWSYLRP